MEKNTKIFLGVGAAIVAILVLNSKKIPQDSSATGFRQPLEDLPKDGMKILFSPPNPGNGISSKKTAVERLTKDCVEVGYNCRENFYNTIQIPIDANCDEYQPDRPQCAEPMDNDSFLNKQIFDNIQL